ncbi:enoyl-CoA hydratase/isomerase family protein [Mycobacterium camsae]|uniref:enoyl-CoA hydratase/isomerase family protein n=1 Tax=Mycobacterium gordonae TaxID=1778 RepID=UPI00197FE67A|nr:enoyl-CoA hydratase/isomerase family protein [Mycobacterium gordonae]
MTYQDYELLRVAGADGICRATIDHPPINLLDIPLLTEIDRLLTLVADDDTVRVLIVDSADPEIFIAHADVALVSELPADDVALHHELSFFHDITERVRTLPKATIAVIEGVCRGGGGEFAMAFDMRYAAMGATVLGHPEVSLGIIPGGGATQRLPRLVGRPRALEVILGGMDVDAETAADWGYINRALPPDQLRPFVDRLARRIASSPQTAITAAKRAVEAATGDLTAGLRIEDQLLRETVAQPDARALLKAVVEAGAQTREFELGATPKPPAS